MGVVATKSTLKANSPAEWARLMALLDATGATAAAPAPFKALKVDARKLTLYVEQDVPLGW